MKPSMKPSFNQLCEWEELNKQGLLPENIKMTFEQAQYQVQQVINASGLREALSKTKSQIQEVIDTSGLKEVLYGVNAQMQELYENIKPSLILLGEFYERKKDHDENYQKKYPLGYYCFSNKSSDVSYRILKDKVRMRVKEYGIYFDNRRNFNRSSKGELAETLFENEYLKIFQETKELYSLSAVEFENADFGLDCIKRIDKLPERVRSNFRYKLDSLNKQQSFEENLERRLELEAELLMSDSLELSEIIEIVEAIENLPDKQQEAIKMFYIQGYTQAEASRQLEISEPSFKERLDNAHKTLRKKFQNIFVQ